MYESPIELLMTDIQHQIVKQQDEEIYKAVVHFFPNIDKAELVRALQYDRGQYEKGYVDGERYAMDSIVRCKDCKWYEANCETCGLHSDDGGTYDFGYEIEMKPDDFCSYGERREGE